MIDSDVVDLVISIIIINLAYYSTVPGAQPNKGTMGETATQFLPDQVIAWTQQIPGVRVRSRLPVGSDLEVLFKKRMCYHFTGK